MKLQVAIIHAQRQKFDPIIFLCTDYDRLHESVANWVRAVWNDYLTHLPTLESCKDYDDAELCRLFFEDSGYDGFITYDTVELNGDVKTKPIAERYQSKYNSTTFLGLELWHDAEEPTEDEYMECLLARLDHVLCQEGGDTLESTLGDFEDTQETERDDTVYFEYRFNGPDDNWLHLIFRGKHHKYPVESDDEWMAINNTRDGDIIDLHIHRDDETRQWTLSAYPTKDRGDGIYETDTTHFFNIAPLSYYKSSKPEHIRV